MNLCTPIQSAPGARRQLAEKAYAAIEAGCREKFSLDKLADSLYVNKCYLVRAFSATFGYSPLVCHNRCRCHQACRLLARRDLSVTEIGYQVGFVSNAHFSRIFRDIIGVTPTDYRKELMDGQFQTNVS